MEFRILGPIELRRDNEKCDLGRAKERCVLGVLALHSARPVPVTTLITALWDDPPDRAKQDLQAYVSRLRASLRAAGSSATVRTEPAGYVFDPGLDTVDYQQFKRLLAGARAAKRRDALDDAAHDLYRAIGLWQGPPLADLDTQWCESRRDDLADYDQLDAYQLLCDIELTRGNFREVLRLVDATAQHEFDTKHIAHRLAALNGLGHYADFDTYWNQIHRKTIKSFGTSPARELQELHSRLLRERDELVPATGPLADSTRRPAQLPPAIRNFVGRSATLNRLDTLLLQARASEPEAPLIIAVTGAAGAGKTALAVRWAHSIREQFPHGHLYVDLAGYGPHAPADPADVLNDLLLTLGVPPAEIGSNLPARAALLRTVLEDRRVLIVLDNARDSDHVVTLLPASVHCVVLVTSRHRLTDLVTHYGASRVELHDLPEHDATELLSTLVTGAGGFLPSTTVTALCSAAQGLPMALRGLAQYALDDGAASEASSTAAADILHFGDNDTRTLFTSLTSSYHALTPAAARLLRLLSLHPDDQFTLPAASALDGSGPRTTQQRLRALLTLNLISRNTDRYRFAPFAKLVAAHWLEHNPDDDRPDAEGRLFHFYLDHARATDRVHATHQQSSVDAALWFGAERANLIAIARRALESGYPRAWTLLAALRTSMLSSEPLQDWFELHELALPQLQQLSDTEGEATILTGMALLQDKLDPDVDVTPWLRTARDRFHLIGNLAGECDTLHLLARQATRLSDLIAAIDFYEQELALHTKLNDPEGLAQLHLELGRANIDVPRYTAALSHLTQAAQLFADIGDPRRGNSVHVQLGILARLERRDGDAENILAGVLAAPRDAVGRRDLLQGLVVLGELCCEQNRPELALIHARRAISLCSSGPKDHRYCVLAMISLVRALSMTGRDTDAAGEAEQTLALIADHDDPINYTVQAHFEPLGLWPRHTARPTDTTIDHSQHRSDPKTGQ